MTRLERHFSFTLFTMLLGVIGLGLRASDRAQAASLTSLPFGSVIQIQGTDTSVCADTTCSKTSTTVPSYKFVKMQARNQTGATVTNPNDLGATYWTLLDNYCWWGSAECTNYSGTVSTANLAYGSTWNGDGTTSGVGNGTSTYNNNLTDNGVNHKITTQLSNFYNSLPNTIGGVAKDTAIITNPYDMFSITATSGTGTTTASTCATNWASRTISTGGNSFTFSDAATCTMTSKVGLMSYTDWQGGLYAYGNYTNTGTLTSGAGGSYCYARFGTDCTAGGSYNNFNTSGTQFRPYYPWLRSPYAGSTAYVWYVASNSSTYSVYSYGNAYGGYGVSPALWLSSSLANDGTGTGTYADPYNLLDCSGTNANRLQCLPFGSVIQIQGTDTSVCADTTCSKTSTTVPSYKFVKMQARNQTGDTVTNPNDSGASYWTLLDNYCWWGSANCTYNSGKNVAVDSAYGTTWNGDGYEIGLGNGIDKYNNNLSDAGIKHKITTQLSNFYNSLPNTIGGMAKDSAVVANPFDMFAIPEICDEFSTCDNAVATCVEGDPACEYGYTYPYSCAPNWTAGTISPGGNPFTFSDRAACTMTSKIGLPSYTEWQGGLNPSDYYTNASSGAGSSFCQARFGTDCTNSGSYGLLDDYSTQFSPYFPWLRSLRGEQLASVWYVYSDSSARSVSGSYAGNYNGVSPSLWLSSSISNDGTGKGTYDDPYNLLDPCSLPENAAKLQCLPFGSVIQIPSTDATVCTDTTCSTTSTIVPPYKFVKMQARNQNGAAVTNPNDSGATYWALLDNYYWWGSAKCTNYSGTVGTANLSYGSTWNGDGSISEVSTYNNNLTDNGVNHKITTQLSNFFNSLHPTIGGVAKDTAIITNPYDMFSITSTSGTGTTTASTCATNWASRTISTGGNSFTFSDAATCTMTSKVGLMSYTDWQGGLYAYGNYINDSSLTSGSSGSYCQARFGTDCTNAGSYGLFGASSTQFSPYYPWFRSPNAGNTMGVWRVNSDSSPYSVSNNYANIYTGVSPSLWLAASEKICGSGTYASPYHLTGDPCNTAPTISAFTSPAANSYYSSVSGYNTLSIIGTVSDPDNDDQTLQYQIDGGTWTNLGNITGMTDGSKTFNFSLSIGSLAAGQHVLNLRSFDGQEYSSSLSKIFNIDKTAPEISATNASNAWTNVQPTAVITATDPVITNQTSGLASVRYSLVSNNGGTTSPASPFSSLAACQSEGTALFSSPLSDLPFGSVIQIQGTDTTVCTNTSCSTTDTTVPPYKFVKMQARNQTGATVTNPNDASATYWALLDNYCWWGGSNCRYGYNNNGGVRYSYGGSWNSTGATTSDYDNNLSSPRTYNVLNILSNFYNSLPTTIGGVAKDTAVISNPFDMFSISATSGTGTTTASTCATGWAANSPNISGNTFTFSNATNCTMTSKVVLAPA